MVATIQYIENVIATCAQATDANLHTPHRSGNVVELTAENAEDVMITADLHGNRRNFNAIKKIADLKGHPRRHLVLQEVCHGGPTYPANGGCMSHGMLEDVAKLKAEFPDRVHFLLSNHEMAELTDFPILKSKKVLNLMFRMGMQQMYGPATEKVREAYLGFLRSCPLGVRLSSGVFVCHSLPEKADSSGYCAEFFHRPLEPIDYQEHSDLFRTLWGRDYRPENARAFTELVGATVLISGHEPCPDGYSVPNEYQVILDCCGEKACYLILPVDQPLSHAQIVERVERL